MLLTTQQINAVNIVKRITNMFPFAAALLEKRVMDARIITSVDQRKARLMPID
jgi:hypothetical protein